MLTRVPEAMRENLKHLAAAPEYGNLRTMNNHLMLVFLKTKPYRDGDYPWKKPAKKGETGWVPFNVVVDNSTQDKVKAECERIEVSLATFLFTALSWWADHHSIH